MPPQRALCALGGYYPGSCQTLRVFRWILQPLTFFAMLRHLPIKALMNYGPPDDPFLVPRSLHPEGTVPSCKLKCAFGHGLSQHALVDSQKDSLSCYSLRQICWICYPQFSPVGLVHHLSPRSWPRDVPRFVATATPSQRLCNCDCRNETMPSKVLIGPRPELWTRWLRTIAQFCLFVIICDMA